jgi:probable HAF family extracellular repeat protein
VSRRVIPSWLGAIGLAGLLASLIFAGSAAAATCSPKTSILKSPRAGSHEVQAKALNDRGDVVGFADGRGGTDRAILWKRGKVKKAVNLGVLPGYVSSEAYAVNNHRVVFGLLYDKKERTFPFRWKAGRMTVLKGPNGHLRQADVPDRNAINERGEIAGTLLISGSRRAVRWTRKGKASFLPALPGHTWTNAWSIGRDGVVSGWSRQLPNDDGENNPVIWTKAGEVIPLKTVPGRADGAAEATNRSGLTVGYLGNLGTDTDPENDNAVAWQSRTAEPQMLGGARPGDTYGELVDVNEHGRAAGMSGTFTENLFPLAKPAIWRTGWASLRTIGVPAKARHHNVVSTQLNDINARGAIVGDVYGLTAPDFGALERVYPVVWKCPFGA